MGVGQPDGTPSLFCPLQCGQSGILGRMLGGERACLALCKIQVLCHQCNATSLNRGVAHENSVSRSHCYFGAARQCNAQGQEKEDQIRPRHSAMFDSYSRGNARQHHCKVQLVLSQFNSSTSFVSVEQEHRRISTLETVGPLSLSRVWSF